MAARSKKLQIHGEGQQRLEWGSKLGASKEKMSKWQMKIFDMIGGGVLDIFPLCSHLPPYYVIPK